MIEYDEKLPKVHPSHKMTEWKKNEVLWHLNYPTFFTARRYVRCRLEQAEKYDAKFIHSGLLYKCQAEPFSRNIMKTMAKLKRELSELEEEIKEAKARLPAHSVKAAEMKILIELEDRFAEVLREIERMKAEKV